MKPINDAFTDLPISRARKYQLRKKAQGKCQKCGKNSMGMTHCKDCFETNHYKQGSERFASTSKRTKELAERRAKRKRVPGKPKPNPWLPPELQGKGD